MEKQRNIKRFRFIFGLLIFFFSGLFSLQASTPVTPEQIRNLEITPVEGQDFSIGKEIKYQLILPGISPLNVQLTNPSSQPDIIFKTLRRTGDNGDGTKIELWYEFTKEGNLKPSPLEIKIGASDFLIPFGTIGISNPLENRKPSLYISFANGKTLHENSGNSLMTWPVSEKLRFTVYAVNAAEIKSIDFDLPKDSLFSKTRDYKIRPSVTPVCDFEWTPLIKGKTKTPEIRITLQASNGTTSTMKVPVSYITVINGKNKTRTGIIDKTFSESFADQETTVQETDLSVQNNSVQNKILNRKKTYLKILLISLAILVLIAALLLLLKKKSPVPYIILSVIMLLVLITFTALSKKSAAVYTEGIIKSIPEENSGKILQIPENTEVKILKSVGNWYCIRAEGITGWTQKENIRIY